MGKKERIPQREREREREREIEKKERDQGDGRDQRVESQRVENVDTGEGAATPLLCRI